MDTRKRARVTMMLHEKFKERNDWLTSQGWYQEKGRRIDAVDQRAFNEGLNYQLYLLLNVKEGWEAQLARNEH